MNETPFENLLKSLPPAAPSATLCARVEHELELDSQWLRMPRRRVAPRWIQAAGWTALGAAAAVSIMSALPAPRQPDSSLAAAEMPAPAVMPVTTVRELLDARDEGIRYNPQSQLPEQHVKYYSVDRHAWIDPRDGAEITVEVPHEDNVVLPVSFQ
jgi:hypothetical protein